MKELRILVRSLLKKDPKLRDNDNALIIKVWSHEYNAHAVKMNKVIPLVKPKLNDLLVGEAFDLVSKGVLSNTEQIRRTRQRVQEKNDKLRGRSYEVRQEKGRQTTKTISKDE